MQLLVPDGRLVRYDFADEIAADKPGTGLGLGNEADIVEIDCRKYAFHCTADSQTAH